MRILPVLDLLEGVVVRGVAGERNRYRPVESQLVDSADPLAVARAFREQLGLDTLYVADLDGILHRQPNLDCYRRLIEEGFRLIIDAGVRNGDDLIPLDAAGAERIILGLETCPSPEFLNALMDTPARERIVFSLDLKGGIPMTAGGGWDSLTPAEIAFAVIEAGICELILLDLAQVGVANGVSTLPLCRQVLARYPNVQLVTGGGVRDAADLRLLVGAGVSGVLLASALHSGAITAATIAALETPESQTYSP